MEIEPAVVGLALLVAGFFLGHYITMAKLAQRHVAQLKAAHDRGRMWASMISSCAYEMVAGAVTVPQFIQVMNDIAMKKFGTMLPLATNPEGPQDGNRIEPTRSPGEERPPQ